LTARNRLLSTFAAVLVLAFAAAGCGGEKSDVSGGVDAINKELTAQNAKLDCPKQVDGGEGAKFDCTLKGTQTGKSEKVKMKIVKQNGSLAVDFADDRAAVQSKLQQVTAG
jgi:hypothetical protein